MIRQIRDWTSVALVIISGTVLAADEQAADRPPSEIGRWIQELGSDSFVQRDFAGRQVLRVGTPAIAPLVGVAGGEDAVAAQTAIGLLARVARDDRGAMGTAAHRGLSQLAGAAKSLSPEHREVIRQAVRAADRRIAGIITSRGGRIERDESLAIIGVQVQDERFTDQQVALLARLPQLRRLDLRETLISDDAIETILTLPELEELNLTDTTVSGEALQRLAPLKSLKKLSIYRLQVSPDQLRDAQAVLPECEIRN